MPEILIIIVLSEDSLYIFCQRFCNVHFESFHSTNFNCFFIYLDADVENYDVSKLLPDHLQQVEADSYWCMAKLLDGIQDNYTFAQPGIQKKVYMLKELMQRIDGLFMHFYCYKHLYNSSKCNKSSYYIFNSLYCYIFFLLIVCNNL